MKRNEGDCFLAGYVMGNTDDGQYGEGLMYLMIPVIVLVVWGFMVKYHLFPILGLLAAFLVFWFFLERRHDISIIEREKRIREMEQERLEKEPPQDKSEEEFNIDDHLVINEYVSINSLDDNAKRLERARARRILEREEEEEINKKEIKSDALKNIGIR